MRLLAGRKVTIQRKTKVSNGQGGWIFAWNDIATERCRIRPASTSERMIAGQDQVMTTHVAYLRAGASIRFDDRIYLDDVGYGVIGIRNPAGMDVMKQIDLSMVQDAKPV